MLHRPDSDSRYFFTNLSFNVTPRPGPSESWLSSSSAGDRTDEVIHGLEYIAARGAEHHPGDHDEQHAHVDRPNRSTHGDRSIQRQHDEGRY